MAHLSHWLSSQNTICGELVDSGLFAYYVHNLPHDAKLIYTENMGVLIFGRPKNHVQNLDRRFIYEAMRMKNQRSGM